MEIRHLLFGLLALALFGCNSVADQAKPASYKEDFSLENPAMVRTGNVVFRLNPLAASNPATNLSAEGLAKFRDQKQWEINRIRVELVPQASYLPGYATRYLPVETLGPAIVELDGLGESGYTAKISYLSMVNDGEVLASQTLSFNITREATIDLGTVPLDFQARQRCNFVYFLTDPSIPQTPSPYYDLAVEAEDDPDFLQQTFDIPNYGLVLYLHADMPVRKGWFYFTITNQKTGFVDSRQVWFDPPTYLTGTNGRMWLNTFY